MASATMVRKVQLKKSAKISFIFAAVIAVASFFMFPFGFIALIASFVFAFYGIQANRKSDELPMDEPEEPFTGFPNISQRTYSDMQPNSRH